MSGTEAREEFYQLNKDRLAELAFRAFKKGLQASDFVVIAIDVDDPKWTEVVDGLMPNYDWDQIRRRGQKPVARGFWDSRPIVEYLSREVPEVTAALTSQVPQGLARAVVLAEGGASVFFIKPIPQSRSN